VRSSVLPDVPTVAEAGVPGFESKAWFGVAAPQGTPQPIVERLNTVMGKALATAELKERFKDIGAEPAPGSPEQFGTFIKAEIVKWGKVVRDSGMTVD
jgi:tripartite-type tricarboxylate transporter receptor subunit TctC